MSNEPRKLFPYQKETILRTEKLNGRALLALDMGLGKTICALKCLQRNPNYLPALIVCPASVKYNWEYEASTYVNMRASICESQTPPIFNRKGFSNVSPLTIINYDILRFWVDYLKQLNFKTIIYDESQFLQNRNSKRSRSAKLISKGIPHILMLSGTPLTNRPSELWQTLNILWPKEYKSFYSFAQKFCSPRSTHWGWDYRGASNLNVLHKELKLHGMIRYRKEDVLKELPPKVRHVIPCELSDRKQYDFASKNFMLWLRQNKGHKVQSAKKAEALVRIGYLLTLSARLKIKNVVNWANRFLEETDEKLILFIIHKAATKVLQKRINAKSVVVDGSVTGRKRKAVVDQFQNDKKTRVFIGQLQAAGIGITLTAASTIGFVELGPRPGDHIQAESRIHRIGQKNTSWINYLIAGGTLEEKLCRILQEKQKVISSVLDGGPTPTDLDIYDELLKELEKE